MSVATRSPFREIESLRERIDRLFGDLPTESKVPPIDVQEMDDQVVVKATMPGIKPEDIEVTVENGMLKIYGESKEERDETKGTWHLVERSYGSVSRSIMLPAAVTEDAAEAKLEDGVLEVRLPKAAPSAQTRIEVKGVGMGTDVDASAGEEATAV
jgi:HSP20 family protein